MDHEKNSIDSFALLSYLTLRANRCSPSEVLGRVGRYDVEDLTHLFEIANIHHVILRSLPSLHRAMVADGNSFAELVQSAMAAEQNRINRALSILYEICKGLAAIGDVVVIKSLDHWPDLGNDLDLFTSAETEHLISLMRVRFQAQVEKQSWGDRLANKWNFKVPGLPELVEVHVARLGQTGEQIEITDSLLARARRAEIGGYTFRVPGPEEQIIISTLQRMYRHFYLRLCDIVNIAGQVEAGTIHYGYLESLARSAGIWDGVATYLAIIVGYVKAQRGYAPELPRSVVDAARFREDRVGYGRRFLRIPIFPQAAGLYAREWGQLAWNGDLRNTLRLSLLPGLAMAALVAAKISGSDKGIW
jgi:hypothetical protein